LAGIKRFIDIDCKLRCFADRETFRKMGTLSKPDYDALYRMTEGLRHDSMLAQERYQAHVAHRC
jgi:hypothetical protein